MTADASEETLKRRLGEALRDARQQAGLTQAEVAELVETDPETISRFERGKALPSLVRLLALAEALKTPMGNLVGKASPSPSDEAASLLDELSLLSPRDRAVLLSVVRAGARAMRPG